MVNIRSAIISDAQHINTIASELGYEPNSDENVQEWLAEILRSGDSRVWVCEHGSSVVGWLHAIRAVRLGSAPFIEIVGVAVNPEFRAMGFGRALVESAKAWAKSQGVKIRVRCSSSRTETYLFYEAVGLSKVKSQVVFETLP